MSTPFLMGFAEALVARLLEERELEVKPGKGEAVAAFLARGLAESREGESLISLTSRVLVKCDDVEELWADNDRLKEIVQDLKR